MASFSNLSKTYAKDKLSKYATTVLLVYCYLYRKKGVMQPWFQTYQLAYH